MALLQNPPPILPPTTETVITYSTPVGEIYIVEQPNLLVSGGTTGLRTWEPSFLVSEWLLEQDIQGMQVLELGAGTGLVGIIAAKKGAKILATDGSNTVVTKLKENYKLNNVIAETQVLRWGEQNQSLESKWDLILGADVTYHEEICSSLAKTYAIGLKQAGLGILAAPVRNEKTLEAFVMACGMDF